LTGDEAEDLSSLGFFDLSMAAPSMKAALKARSADCNPFRQGAVKETGDPKDGEAGCRPQATGQQIVRRAC
jgi:hypothetical protein